MVNKLLLTLYRSITHSALITGKTTKKMEWFRYEESGKKVNVFGSVCNCLLQSVFKLQMYN